LTSGQAFRVNSEERRSMKKLFIVVVSIVLTAGVCVFPAMAGRQFEVRLIPCGVPGVDGCGLNPPATHPLLFGSIELLDNNSVRVLLIGAQPHFSYRFYVGNWEADGTFLYQFLGDSAGSSIGTVNTTESGTFHGFIRTDSGRVFRFPADIGIRQPNFAVNSEAQTQFTTGFITQ
jgi:hypothetical protein